jgi:hypothetical protein
MYNPAKGSKPEQAPPDADEGAGVGFSGAGPGAASWGLHPLQR